jgi:hypothetical protein
MVDSIWASVPVENNCDINAMLVWKPWLVPINALQRQLCVTTNTEQEGCIKYSTNAFMVAVF